MQSTDVDEFLTGLLKADATLTTGLAGRVYQDLAPEGAALPYALISFQAGNDTNSLGIARMLTQDVWQVQIIADADSMGYADLKPLGDALDGALQGSHSGAQGAGLTCWRQQAIRRTEATEDGKTYLHVGGLYRVTVQGEAGTPPNFR